MALINCPDCKTEVSDQAETCPKCARPLVAKTTQTNGQPTCQTCHSTNLKKSKEYNGQGTGCLITVVGLLLAPVLIGIPIILWGINHMSKPSGIWLCKKCGHKSPRQIAFGEGSLSGCLTIFVIFMVMCAVMGSTDLGKSITQKQSEAINSTEKTHTSTSSP